MSKIIQDISILRQKSENVTSVEEAKSLISKLEGELAKLDNGVGLAAIQLGYPKKVGVIKKSDGTFIYLINPELIEATNEFIFLHEGCLSFPNRFRDTKRYYDVTIKNYRIEENNLVEETLSFYYSIDNEEPGNDGLVAIAIQHELDHFDGITIFHKADIQNEPIKRITAKIGRNDKCCCGSGKKYKKCCGKNVW